MHNVQVVSQRTPSMCWEACAQMMWSWRHKSLSNYSARASGYTSLNSGLNEAQMNAFYTSLGIRSLSRPRGANLRHALKWSPVVFCDVRMQTGHAIVAVGWVGNQVRVVNPCGVQSVSFISLGEADATCTASTHLISVAKVEESLGRFVWYW